MTTVALVLLFIAASVLLLRVILGPSLADRAVALDALLTTTAAGVIVAAAQRRDITTLDTAIVVSLVGFVGTAIVARFIERKGL